MCHQCNEHPASTEHDLTPPLPRHRRLPSGFTLLELLIVCIILSLLLLVVGPGLARTRQTARLAMCENTLHAFGQGMLIYTLDNQEYIPGTNTSGVTTRERDLLPERLSPSTVPVQSFDWMTPILQDQPLPDNRADRWHYLWTEFACPLQSRTALLYAGGAVADYSDFVVHTPWPACSYLMPTYFQLWGSNHAGMLLGAHEETAAPIYAQTVQSGSEVASSTFRSRIDAVGSPVRKVFVADGTRYMSADGLIDCDISATPTYFGAFSSGGAWTSISTAYGVASGSKDWSGRPVYAGNPSNGLNIPASYRHPPAFPFMPLAGQAGGIPSPRSVRGNRGAMNVVCFDGHVERLNDEPSRDIDRWYPSGCVVKSPSMGLIAEPYGYVIP